MIDIHKHYADSDIKSFSIYALPIISDRDIDMMRWVVLKMPVQNSVIVNTGFLSFLIILKGKVEERILSEHQRQENEMIEALEKTWIRLFDKVGIDSAKQEAKRMWGSFPMDEKMKFIFNKSYQNAKDKWER